MRKPPEKGISTYKAVRENIDEPMVLFPEIPGNVESEIVGITPSRSTSSSARKRTVTYASHPSSRVLLAAAQTARDSIGAVAEAKVREQSSSVSAGQPQAIHAVDVRRGLLNEPNEQSAPLLTSLARLKNSLEMGVIGEAVKRTDVIPGQTYNTLGKIGQVVSNQESAERFLSFPGADELSQHPKIVALRNDPEISQMIAQGHFVDLLQNEKIINAANDPKLVQELKKFDLQKALDYATQAH